MPPKKKNTAFMKPLELSDDLKAIVGNGPMPRTEVVKKLWVYIKKNGCQDKRIINPDAKLAKVLGNKPIDMFEMNKKISAHLS